MSTPAKRYREQCTAVAAAHDVDLMTLTPYQRLFRQLYADKAVLKSIKSHLDKQQAKADLLPSYSDWLQGVLASGQIVPEDRITPIVMIWQLDCGLLDETMPLAKIAMFSQAESPDEFQRSLPEIIVEQYAEQMSAGANIAPENVSMLIDWAVGKNESGQHIHNLPDPIRAKMLKAAGEYFENADPPNQELALNLYNQAIKYNEKIGLKKKVSLLQSQTK